MTNPNGPANGLEVFDTALTLGLAGLGLWWLWRHPVSFFATLGGLLLWWEAESAGHPVWPWLLVAAFVGLRKIGTLVRWITSPRGVPRSGGLR